MPNLKEVLINNELLRFRYLIIVEGRNYNENKYYKIEDEEVKRQHLETCEDMSRNM